jgi:hypothetical protein
MEQSIISYNSAKLSEIEQEIADITVDSKLPVKIIDSEGKIKKYLLHQTSSFAAGYQNYIYLKFPEVPMLTAGYFPSIEFNIKVDGYLVGDRAFTLFKIVIYIDSSGEELKFICNFDNTSNALKLAFNEQKIVYYEYEEGKRHYYLKILFNTNLQKNLTYLDLSTNSYIPEDFSPNNMIVSAIPGTEVNADYTITMVNPLLNAIKLEGSTNIGVITTSTSNPVVNYPYIYGGTNSGTWSRSDAILTKYYIWTFNGV